jgi:hypothetical protein
MVYDVLICIYSGYILQLCECDECDNRLFNKLQSTK